MLLSELIKNIDGKIFNLRDTAVTSLECDTRKLRKGAVFVAIKGEKFDGHKFIDEAKDRGAVAVVTQTNIPTTLPQVVVPDTRTALGRLARTFYGDFPTIKKIGVTGTNGKTTTAFLINSILATAGLNPAMIGTIYYQGQQKIKAERTTPESLEIFRLLHDFQNQGTKIVVMEVSSHALSLKRVDEIKFDAAVFTNLSQDHLDFHKSIAEYEKAKLRIFSLLEPGGWAIFNLDDPVSTKINDLKLPKTITYGLNKKSDFSGQVLSDTINGLTIEVSYRQEKYRISSVLIGSFNTHNLLATFATGMAFSIKPEKIVQGIETLERVRGRMERVVDNIFVDFAHTPDALKNALTALRKYALERVIVVFGCGGNRDRDKRPKMGSIATQLADFSIITSDNPRNEDPHSIIKEIEKGVKTDHYKVIEDRKKAIEYAVSIKKNDDILLIAGKGHEEYQIIGDKTMPFDDTKVVQACFAHS